MLKKKLMEYLEKKVKNKKLLKLIERSSILIDIISILITSRLIAGKIGKFKTLDDFLIAIINLQIAERLNKPVRKFSHNYITKNIFKILKKEICDETTLPDDQIKDEIQKKKD